MTEPTFDPPFGGADLAIALGRRRRAVRIGAEVFGAAGTVSIALVVALVLHQPGSPRADRLQIANDPTPSATATASQTASPGPDVLPTLPPLGPASPLASPSPGPTPSAADTGMPEPDTAYPTPDRLVEAPVRSTVAFTDGSDCSTNPPMTFGSSVGWCIRYSGDAIAKRGGTARIAIDLCKLPNTGQGSITFDDADGLAMDVGSGGTTFWTSQDGRKVAQTPFTVTVAAGQCERWTTHWDTRDRTGFRVPPMTVDVGYGFSSNGGSYGGNAGSLTLED